MKKLILFLSLFCIFTTLAQKRSPQASPDKIFILSGKIKGFQTGENLVGANLTILENGRGVTNTEKGYSIELPTGSYTLQVSFVGYETRIIRYDVKINASQNLDIELLEKTNELEELKVTDQIRDRNVSKIDMGVTKLNIKTIKKIPAFLGEVDVVRSILLLPGVSTVGEGATGFNVRGGSIDQNLVLMDDAPVYNSSHLMGLFSVFNPDMLQNMTFYRGGVPAQYGGRTSSVLDIKIKEPDFEKVSGQGGVGLVASRFLIETPLIKKKLAVALGGRASFSDYLFKVIPNQAVQNTKANFYDLTAKLSFKPSARDQIYFTGYLGNDVFKVSGDSLSLSEINASSSEFNWRTLNGTLRWNHTFNEKLYGSLVAVSSDYQANITNPDEAYAFALDTKLSYRNLRLDFNYIQKNQKIDFGISAIQYDLNPGTLRPTNALSNVNAVTLSPEKALESAIYANHEWEISKGISLTYGLRYATFANVGPASVNQYRPNEARSPLSVNGTVQYANGQTVATYGGLEPRAALRLAVGSSSSVKLSYNRMRQYIHLISNTTAALPTARWKVSDTYTRPQMADQVSIGFFKNFSGDAIEFSVEAYYKDLTDMVDYKDGANLLLNAYPEAAILQGKGRSQGVEVMLQKKVGKLSGWAAYTYAQTELQMNGAYPTEKINGGNWYAANYNKPHTLNLVTNYQASKRVSYSANFTYSTGRPYTPPQDKYYIDGIYVPNYVGRNLATIPDYHRLDLSMTIEANAFSHKKFKGSWVISLYNVYAHQNAYSVFFKTKNDNLIQYFNKVSAYQLSVFGSVIPSVTYNFKF